ncbi:MAG TPA: hypothetical protein VER55_12465, partial [Ardenticatenaceae bacterium]|nr:hypothetical protein [Ardenticatenaceae bacterium]
MNALLHEITQQPHALRDLARFYCDREGAAILSSLPTHATTGLTGMGASFHAAAITALHLHAL